LAARVPRQRLRRGMEHGVRNPLGKGASPPLHPPKSDT
jgi:hypothetical protein